MLIITLPIWSIVMRIKIVLGLFAILCFVLLTYNNTPIPDSRIHLNEDQLSDVIIDNKETSVTVNKDLLEPKTKTKTTTPEILKTTNIYDDDPVIETQLIIENNKRCYQQLSTHKNMIKYNQLAELKLTQNQKVFLDEYKKYCEQLNELHPEFKLTDIRSIRKQQNSSLANSQWGQIMTGEIDVSTLSDYEISQILKKNDLNILTLAPKYLEKYYQKIIHWELEDVLQNHQYDYINYIQFLTHQLYLCESGSDCSPKSSIMASLCYQNSLNCGLDYPMFINSTLTQGQQLDIKLALEYLKGQYQ